MRQWWLEGDPKKKSKIREVLPNLIQEGGRVNLNVGIVENLDISRRIDENDNMPPNKNQQKK
jgi:hypothetical protein